jgi:hypothetical protein
MLCNNNKVTVLQCINTYNLGYSQEGLELQGPIIRSFFQGKISAKIPQKIFPKKMLGKNGIFRGKKCTKNWPLVCLSGSCCDDLHAARALLRKL